MKELHSKTLDISVWAKAYSAPQEKPLIIIMEMIRVHNLSKSYGKVNAVYDLSIAIDDNPMLALVGPNGAGKTTTLKMMLGLLRPDSGWVRVFGENPWDNSRIRQRVGVVFDKAFFPPHQRALTYLERTSRIFGVEKDRASSVLKLVGLDEARNRPIQGLSAGMLQKFAVAHALIHHPELVIADEMTSNLDPQARREILDIVLQLHREEKVGFILSSHILSELSKVCDTIAIMNHGSLMASGKLSDLYDRYGIGTVRITTDKPEALGTAISKLSYVKSARKDSGSVSVSVRDKDQVQLFQDIPRLAGEVGAIVKGIETSEAALDELYSVVITGKRRL